MCSLKKHIMHLKYRSLMYLKNNTSIQFPKRKKYEVQLNNQESIVFNINQNDFTCYK